MRTRPYAAKTPLAKKLGPQWSAKEDYQHKLHLYAKAWALAEQREAEYNHFLRRWRQAQEAIRTLIRSAEHEEGYDDALPAKMAEFRVLNRQYLDQTRRVGIVRWYANHLAVKYQLKPTDCERVDKQQRRKRVA